MAGGYTLTMPEQDHYIMQRGKMLDEMAKILGGRAAEEIVFDEISTGASDDLDKVSKLARAMVMRYGMSEKLGPLVYGKKEELVFLGKEIGEQRDYSESKAQAIDEEVQNFVMNSYERAKEALREHREQLNRVAEVLLERETLTQTEFTAVMEGRPLPVKQDTSGGDDTPAEVDPVLKPSPATA
jgi:cell division protease FtsH